MSMSKGEILSTHLFQPSRHDHCPNKNRNLVQRDVRYMEGGGVVVVRKYNMDVGLRE